MSRGLQQSAIGDSKRCYCDLICSSWFSCRIDRCIFVVTCLQQCFWGSLMCLDSRKLRSLRTCLFFQDFIFVAAFSTFFLSDAYLSQFQCLQWWFCVLFHLATMQYSRFQEQAGRLPSAPWPNHALARLLLEPSTP